VLDVSEEEIKHESHRAVHWSNALCGDYQQLPNLRQEPKTAFFPLLCSQDELAMKRAAVGAFCGGTFVVEAFSGCGLWSGSCDVSF